MTKIGKIAFLGFLQVTVIATASVTATATATATTTATATAVSANTDDEKMIPTFSFTDLQKLSGSNRHNHHYHNHRDNRADEFRKALSSNGLLAIRLDDEASPETKDYSRDRKTALDGLCSCIDHPDFLDLDQTHELILSSTTRTSVATATAGLDHPLPLPEGLQAACGTDVWNAMEGLRDTLATVSSAFASALDGSLIGGSDSDNYSNTNNNSQFHNGHGRPLMRDEFGKSYESITDIVRAANHLEHFHVYTNHQDEDAEGDSVKKNDVAWDWHTDAGLFLVFVPAWDCHGNDDESNADNSFYYRDTNGATVRAEFDGGRTAIVMLGQGAQDWLDLPVQHQHQQHKSSPLKATTHSVRWSESESRKKIPDQRRAWYGMMNLVPESALIYGGKTLREVKQSLSLSHQRKNNFETPPYLSSGSGDTISMGCGSLPVAPLEDEEDFFELEEVATTERRGRRLQMQDAAMCNNVTNFFCWMTCIDIPKLDQAKLYLEAGYSLYCLDDSVLKSTGSMTSAHEACEDRHNMGCKGQWEKIMDGIPPAEINIETSMEEIEMPFCYSGTTMYMEGFQWIQSSTCVIFLFESWVLDSAWKYVLAVIGTTLAAIGLEKFIQQRRKTMALMEAGTTRLIASAVFYIVQLAYGYLLMLVIMIYSGVLFLAVILGLGIGHVFFNARDAIWPIYDSPHLNDDNSITVIGDGDGERVGSDGSNRSDSSREIESTLPQTSCCTSITNMLREPENGEERALREGSTYCQDFESDNNQECYGSIENANIPENVSAVVVAQNKKAKRKTIDVDVPEGSTPCCQHGW